MPSGMGVHPTFPNPQRKSFSRRRRSATLGEVESWKIESQTLGWSKTKAPWQETVTEWWNRALAAHLHHVSCLRIPRSL